MTPKATTVLQSGAKQKSKTVSETEALQPFEDLKSRFESLQKEARAIHEQWQRLHQEPGDRQKWQSQSELIRREVETLEQIREVLNTASELIQRQLLFIRQSRII